MLQLVPQMRESSEAFQDVRCQLTTATETLNVVNRLVVIQETLESSQSDFDDEHFVEAVNNIDKLDTLTADLLRMWKSGGSEQSQIQALSGLDTECLVRREKLTHDLSEIWKASVVWDDENVDCPTVTLRVLRSRWDRNELVWAMHRLKCLESKLKAFARRLLERVVVAILTNTSDLTTSTDDEHGKVVLKLKVISVARPSPSDVFAKLHVMLEFLNDVFGCLPADAGLDDRSPARLFGDVFRTDFYDLLIKECLGPAVPSKRGDLDAYAQVVDAVSKLQARLLDIGMTTNEDDGIAAYARNVDALFANKMCQEILVKARKLMLRELHETIRPPDAQPEPKADGAAQRQNQNLLDRNILKFPVCQIR